MWLGSDGTWLTPRCEIVGGEDKIDPVRERFFGDQFINSFGAEQFDREEVAYQDLKGWHTDNDW